MKTAYPIILTPSNDGGFTVYVPDFDANTQGDDAAHAIEMARDAIGLMGIDMEDDGKALPKPSDVKKIQRLNPEDIVTLVDVDFVEYRRQNEFRSVKKNCTIPGWLNHEAEKANVNFSAVLQDALKQKLHISDR